MNATPFSTTSQLLSYLYECICLSEGRRGNARLTLVTLLALSQLAAAGYLRQILFGSTGRWGGRKPGEAAAGRV